MQPFFTLERPSASSLWWYVMVGGGVKERCGAVLVYRSRDLRQGGAGDTAASDKPLVQLACRRGTEYTEVLCAFKSLATTEQRA